MPNILTPVTLWEAFDASLETSPVVLSSKEREDGIIVERVNFSGRKTGGGRVVIAAGYAYDKNTPASGTVLILPDSRDSIDEETMALFVKQGYAALMVDYRGEWEGCDFYTRYPADVAYANTKKSGRRYAFVDESAAETSWYEWVAVGIYAKKYAAERSGNDKIAVVGLRDGGEIAWKLGVAEKFKCIIPVCAAGWKAYAGVSKFLTFEPDLNEERYRYIAGIDSQAYAPYIKCPVLMLCATNDAGSDYDRAYDTFSRINPEFVSASAIAYSVHSNGCIGEKCTSDMFMFLDKNLKDRQVFIPKPSEIVIEVDDESNLVATVKFDSEGIVDYCEMYMAEDCVDSSLRDWIECPPKTKISPQSQQFYLNIYEKTSTVFAMCYVRYINGFSVWSKISAKKLNGMFRNMRGKCRVIYSDKDSKYAFALSEPRKFAVGNMFLLDKSSRPAVVEKDGVKGLYAVGGLTTYKLNSPAYAPVQGNILKLDVFCGENCKIRITLVDGPTGEEYTDDYEITGGVWQSIIAESKLFKNSGGVSLENFMSAVKLTVSCGIPYAINNVMWL